MLITFLGTAAGEANPGVFCDCEICRTARRLGGKNIRTRSQTLINDDLLIDLPPDNYLHTLYYGLDLSKVRTLLFTHSHADHCYPADLELLREPYSHTADGKLQIYGNEAVREKVKEACEHFNNEEARFMYHVIDPFETVQAGSYTITALKAKHAPQETALFYHISQGDKAILYAHDTGDISEEVLNAMEKLNKPLSLVSLDCTMQKHRDGTGHMGLEDDAEKKETLLRRGLANENTIFVVNHFSHNGGWLHDELCENAAKFGMIASYDGMKIDF